MDWKLEVVIAPVSDVERARAFYVDTLGFRLDTDFAPERELQGDPGDPARVGLLDRLRHRPRRRRGAGSLKGAHLVVDDIEAAHAHLDRDGHSRTRGRSTSSTGVSDPGVEPDRADYGTFIYFDDPDGNSWAVQEVKHHAR